jgi:NAD(P)-dependent dehydrogenase (short-subunit alcohol dehydrogenase family)
MRFAGKTVLVVGGNSGIGLATAQAFGREGASVVITGRDPQTLDDAVAAIPGASGHRTDIADCTALAPVVEAIATQHGHLDVLFVNAGVGAFAPIRAVTPELWDQIHAVNLRGCFFAVQQALPLLRSGSAVVLTGSIGADAAIPGNAIYASAKAGLRAVTRILAKELVGEGIRVNMVSPGPIETPLINRNIGMSDAEAAALRETIQAAVPMGRIGAPEDVAGAVLYLASAEAGFITGANLTVDGGTLDLR